MAAISTPGWYQNIQQAFARSEAHAFIVSGDLAGYVEQTVTPRRYLNAALAASRKGMSQASIVATYHPARGVTFLTDDMRERAAAMVTDGQPPAPAPDPFAAALGGGLPAAQADPFASSSPAQALRSLDRLLRADLAVNQVAVIIDRAELVCPDTDKASMPPDGRTILAQLLLWATDEQLIYKASNMIVLLVEDASELHADLRSASAGWRSVDIPMPDETRRRTFLDYYLTAKAIPLQDVTVTQLARLTAGLNLRNIEDVLLEARQQGAVSADLVKSRKASIIRSSYSEIAEMLEPLPGGLDDLGGLEWVKDYMRKRVISAVEDGRLRDVPKGILLVGPPGTGKTYAVRALAGAVKMNCVALRSEKIQDSLVGESERKLARFFDFVKALAPTLVFMDELDQSDMGSRGNSSGNPVAKNLFNQVLQFTSDETIRGKVICVFASNRPDLLDPALMRAGRMDAIIPVLLPDAEDRVAIAQRHISSLGMTAVSSALTLLREKTEKWSAADVASAITEAGLLSREIGADTITEIHMGDALSDVQPATPQTAEYYTRLAVQACNRRSLLPPQYRDLLDDRPALAQSIKREKAAANVDLEDFGLRGDRNV